MQVRSSILANHLKRRRISPNSALGLGLIKTYGLIKSRALKPFKDTEIDLIVDAESATEKEFYTLYGYWESHKIYVNPLLGEKLLIKTTLHEAMHEAAWQLFAEGHKSYQDDDLSDEREEEICDEVSDVLYPILTKADKTYIKNFANQYLPFFKITCV